MVAALGETTSGSSLPRLRDIMLASAEGRKILKDRPRINSSTIDLGQLAQYPEGSFGRAYVTWLERCGVTPDTREPVSLLLCHCKTSPTPQHRDCSPRSTISLTRNWPMSCNATANATTFIIAYAISPSTSNQNLRSNISNSPISDSR